MTSSISLNGFLLAHKYVVWFVLWNWCLIYFEELAGKLEEELKGIASMIEETAYSRKALMSA